LIEFGLRVLEKKIFFLIFSAILLFCFYFPLERGNPLHLNKLESLPPWPAGSREEDFFFNFQCNFTVLFLFPLGEGQSPSFEQT
jgi:hypothetical protein